MKYVCALIVVEDMQVARGFYENVLGQRVRYDFGENLEYEGGFSLHLGEHYRKLIGVEAGPGIKDTYNFELYFETDQLDATYITLEQQGVRFVHKLREQPWGQRVMRFYDPDGHIVEVGEAMEAVVRRFHSQGMDKAEVSRRSSMPMKFVEAVIGGRAEI